MKVALMALLQTVLVTGAFATGPTKIKYASAFQADNKFWSASKSRGSDNEQLSLRFGDNGAVGVGAFKTFGTPSDPASATTALFASGGNNESYGQHPDSTNTSSLLTLDIYSGGAPGYFNVNTNGCTGDCTVKITAGSYVHWDVSGQSSTMYDGNCGSEFAPELIRAVVHKTSNNTIGWAEGYCEF